MLLVSTICLAVLLRLEANIALLWEMRVDASYVWGLGGFRQGLQRQERLGLGRVARVKFS